MAKDYAWTTAERVADFAGLGELSEANEARMERIIDALTEFCEKYIGYRVQETEYTNEEYSTEEGQTLVLKNSPVSSSDTFTLQRRTSSLDEDNWETVGTKYYHVDYDTGIIYGAGGWEFSRTRNGFRVTYTAGYSFNNSDTFLVDTTAGDLEMVAWQLATVAYNRRGGAIGVKSERIGDYSIVYGKAMLEDENIKAVLDKYATIGSSGVLTPLQI